MTEEYLHKRDEPAYNVLMLDLDPLLAARYHCDFHVRKQLVVVTQLLSAAWQVPHNPWRMMGKYNPPNAELFRWICPPCMYRVKELTSIEADGPVYTGDKPFTLLLGQRIPDWFYEMDADPTFWWVMASGGNYAWLWRHGMKLADEYERRFGHYHKSTQYLWTLEALPPSLWETEEVCQQPEPLVSWNCVVETNGVYDTVGSYRKWYVERRQALLHWTNTPVPDWLDIKGDEYILTKNYKSA